MPTEPIDRPSARVILIGPTARTLLFRGGDPVRPEAGTFWFTPGGGVDDGETLEEAARRELWEETGQDEVEWGVLVATRRVIFQFMGSAYRSIESFYVAHTRHLDVEPMGLTPIEEQATEEHRWLGASEIDHLVQPVYPRQLASVLGTLAVRDYPARPWSWVD